ncbi:MULTISPECIES: 3'-5' exonuclease [Microbacterium]|uniref:3'-5' exonuclease n=1 Tax=Microbacterium TaxID=33882 RepID=UPI00109B7F34|nr:MULTISPECIES: 3'-5' exonuclease [Microbacterium]MCV0333601.1 3'-5' exonuclease [Microbacterium sp.]MCV0374881.1 3'-5' exonuclease [Microbacterium sp.]MCV0388599.1 3'-5' exonuclease [Microbacterium sp.]MCV0417127.1 3'-5' exonuclease [Microbacterium sp.]MCV0420438.1 3'-5' exonuclease [Microbacterium sp.]
MPAGPPLPAWLTRVGVFDLETTGVDVESDRVVTAYVGILDADGRQVAARSWLADPGVPIPDGATAVHGITTAHARAHGRPVPEVVAEVTAALRSLFRQGVPVVAYNASFDFSLLACEAARHGVDPLTDPAPVIDPLVIDKAYDRYRRGRRTLEVVAAHYAVPLEGAHEASADAIAAGRVAQALARQFRLPENPVQLHTHQIGWARSQAANLTEYFVSIGRLEPDDMLDGRWPVRHAGPIVE